MGDYLFSLVQGVGVGFILYTIFSLLGFGIFKAVKLLDI